MTQGGKGVYIENNWVALLGKAEDVSMINILKYLSEFIYKKKELSYSV